MGAMAEAADTTAATADPDDAAQAAATGDADANAQSPVDDDAPAGTGSESSDELRRARDDAAKYRTRLRAVEHELDALKSAGMSDQEKRDREHDDMAAKVTKLETSNRMLRAEKAATAIGVDPELADAAVALIGWDDIDDPTDQKQIERALRDIVKAKPKLAGGGAQAGFSGGEGRTTRRQSGDMNDIIRRAANRQTVRG